MMAKEKGVGRLASAEKKVAKANRLQRDFEREVMNPKYICPMFILPDGKIIGKATDKEEYTVQLEDQLKRTAKQKREMAAQCKEEERRRLYHQNEAKLQHSRLVVLSESVVSSSHIISEQEMKQREMEMKLMQMTEKLVAEEKLGTTYQNVSKRAYESQGLYLRGQVEYYQNAVAECKKTLKGARKELYKAKRTAKTHPQPKLATSRLSMEAQNRIAAADMSTVLALEAAEEQATKGTAMVKENALLNVGLKEAREKVLAVQKKLDESTPRVDLLGKKGQRYDVYIIETVLILMSLGTTAADACQAFGVFMERTYPRLKVNVDYRIPGDWFFKGIADILYPIGVIGPRKLADVCVRMYLGLDGSPRDGHDYAGLSYRLVVPAGYIGDGNVDDATVNCAASLFGAPS